MFVAVYQLVAALNAGLGRESLAAFAGDLKSGRTRDVSNFA